MCFGGPDIPNTSEELAQKEAERTKRVQDTSNVVNAQFDTKYGPDYYNGIGEAYRGYYRPKVEEQAREAGRQTTFRFADNANSSAANRVAAELFRDKTRAVQDVEAGAADARSAAKQQVEDKRGSLLNLAEAGGSLENTAAQARAAAGSNLGQPTFSPVGDLFSKYTNTLSYAANRDNAGYSVNPVFQKQIDYLRGGRRNGSERTVG